MLVTANHLGLRFLANEIMPKIKDVGSTKNAMNPIIGTIEVTTPVTIKMKAKIPVLFEFQTDGLVGTVAGGRICSEILEVLNVVLMLV